jgi:chaperonin GroEL
MNIQGKEAREALYKGIATVANAVGATLGPKGRFATVYRGWDSPEVTKDGVSVAKDIKVEDPFQNIGAELIKSAAIKTNEIAGDGTTTATVLTLSLTEVGLDLIKDYSPIKVKKTFDSHLKLVVDALKTSALEVKDSIDKIEQVANISSNNDKEISSLIRQAVEQVGIDGMIFFDKSTTNDNYIKKLEGMEFPSGYASPYFVTDPVRQECVYDNPLIIITDKKLEVVQDITKLIEYAQDTNRPLVIIAEEFENNVLTAIIRNRVQSQLKIVCCTMAGLGDYRKENFVDLCKFTGGTLVTSETGMSWKKFSEDHFGSCERVVLSKNKSTFIGGAGDPVELATHYENVKAQKPAESVYNKGKYIERLSRLSGKVATIHLGAVTPSELNEKMARLEDAINAVKSSIEEGVVAGGGTALIKACASIWKTLDEDDDISRAFINGLNAPFFKLLDNAGVEEASDIYLNVLKNPHPMFGYDINTETYGDLWEMGILDTVKATIIALEAAVSISTNVIMTEVLINVESRQGPSPFLPIG